MKRIRIGVLLFALGTSVFCGLGSSAAKLRRERDELVVLWQSKTQAVAEAVSKRAELEGRVRQIGEQLKLWQQLERESRTASDSKRYFASSDLHLFLSPETSETLLAELGEALLAELGFNWNTTGDFIVISKATLFEFGMNGLSAGKLSDAAVKALAIRPAEQAAIEDLTLQAGNELKQWVTANVRRDQPEKDYLMQLTIPANPGLSAEMRNRFTNGIVSVLGSERGQAMTRYASQWMDDMRMWYYFNERPTIIQVHRIGGLESELELRRGATGGISSFSISPEKPMPPIVSLLYPGGWEELAAREGFELPGTFRKQMPASDSEPNAE